MDDLFFANVQIAERDNRISDLKRRIATAAMRKLREAVMTANASIATQGGFYR